ncbi:glycosyltransferase [Paenibacillus nasutitermitis]|uniref:Glycosyltransferase n=1 Tax=Paenibacillus nasutitermitis TaxID=1652958 RepID=A0A917E0D5_9BACL|nr:glycosyltransferase [Paenibacillus nasutitermitis]GGD90769.1 hypothetical protein GCM10010911_56840 [Paenibacillus nasutitermitis]
MANYQVTWKGPMHRNSGLGVASREYVRALRRQGVDVKQGTSYQGFVPQGIGKKRRVLIYHFLPNTINLAKERKLYNRIILNTVWETTRIPGNWVPYINKFDAVCVPSTHNKQALRRSGVRVPVSVVPHGINAALYKPDNMKLPVPNAEGRFVFVSVFGFQHRKNPETLLRAYWEAFSAADNVMLVIKTNGYSPHETEGWIMKRIQRYKDSLGIRKPTAPVVVLAHRMSNEQLKGIYTRGDAFVLPTRGEGVGLPFLESLSSGTPVIATGWGGHMDFLTPRNSFLVSYTLRNPAGSMNSKHAISRQFRGLFARKGQLWAEPDRNSLKRQMRLAFQNPGLCRQKGEQGRRDVARLSWGRSGVLMKQAIERAVYSRS